ncbi:MAG: MFS transporter [Acidimicrobiales bacterium]
MSPTARTTPGSSRPVMVLAVVLVAAFAINLDTTIVNVALPSLNRQLGAGTSSLQWVVDGYNLAFAALVLAGGNLGDRYGRREILAAGLALFGAASAVSALCSNVDELIAVRLATGAAAALIFPTTLSIITNIYPERRARARAIGAWGAVAGVGVAVGPVAGGALLDRFWWGSVFLAMVPAAAAGLLGALVVVPPSRAPGRPPLDRGGLALSALALGALVYTVIEAPSHGWASGRSVAGFGLAAVVFVVFGWVERGRAAPMLDVRLFANPRFSAASGSVTVAYFALFGFIFLITQYFQQLRGYSPLGTGVRVLPVAASVAVGSVAGAKLAVRIGNKSVVALGLLLLAAGFAWISRAGALLGYDVMAAQMVLVGTGMGLTGAAATESIMGVVRPDQAGAGSAVNDATREVGGTLGVAVVGSVYSSLYLHHLSSRSLPQVPASLLRAARGSFGAGQAAGLHLVDPALAGVRATLERAVTAGFLHGLHAACWVASGVCLGGMVAALGWLPSRPGMAATRRPAGAGCPELRPPGPWRRARQPG